MGTIYKSEQAKNGLMKLYDEKLESLRIDYTEVDVDTQFGRTRVIQTGNVKGKPIVLFHGFNAGAPLTLEAITDLRGLYSFFAVDTVGQVTKSEETTMKTKGDSYAVWANEVIEKLNIEKANVIGISYGAFIVQKLITHKPERVEKCIFVVPSGIVNGKIWDSITKLTIPLLRFRITKKDKHLKAFTNAFAPQEDHFLFQLLKSLMLGVKLNTKIPTLLKRKDIAHFNHPVYIIAALDDVFFPGKKVAKKSKSLFTNLKEVYFLNDSKHMPSKSSYSEIQLKIREWVN
ncbi:alpha/beta hydrolase [Ulvibacterium sp.]|uniref:alpha/beta fold hydrolase n=1 Tax=Ulvibacterium sp. TaxID=2665914 RepID=UPI0026070990|nr:alpha/beta hydrolase [Ulvibacterium sp.]